MKIDGRKPLVGEPVRPLNLEDLVIEAAASARPPQRLTVAQAAEEYRFINNPGAFVGPWQNDTTPYLVEPMNELQSLDFTGMVFVGPAQSGKTDMVLNWISYAVKCDPADMMIVQTSNITARDFSMRRIDRLHRHSPLIGQEIVAGQGDNTFDKGYKSGMLLTLSWPSINELSGKPIPRLWLTDYDRMPEDVDGEGNAFDLARKRATTFRRFGMCAAESSPGYVVDNPQWVRKTPHEAPPTRGILSLYNRGDKRRWYWKCVSCDEAFEPSFELIRYPDLEDKQAAAEQATLHCPHCDIAYHHDPKDGMPGKHEMNRRARWLKDGQRWVGDQIIGNPPKSDIASFWLKGVAAAFSDWERLVLNYLNAEEAYANTGSEQELKTTINTDQGEPYTPKTIKNLRTAEGIKDRARDYGVRVVPPGVRCLIACVDVQKHRFVVQVHGFHESGDIYVIDRFDIQKSNRLDDEGERLWVNPATHPEDWKLIATQVMQKTYPLADESGREMAIKMTLSDSGGKEGVTTNAYNFYRWLKNGPGEDDPESDKAFWEPGLVGRFMLLKGASTMTAPRVAISFPDSQRKDRMAGARGEVPVMIINTHQLKDAVNNRLDRKERGGRYCFPNWLDSNFYVELTVEVRSAAKGWENPRNYRNESWDLLTYAEAATLHPNIRLDRIKFDDPPPWAEEWDRNDLVFNPAGNAKPFEAKKQEDGLSALAKLAEQLA